MWLFLPFFVDLQYDIFRIYASSILLSDVTLSFQADREREEAEEAQKELGLGEEEDSLVMMLKVTTAHTHTYVTNRFRGFSSQ